MSETKINASQTTITANDIGAAPVYDTMPTAAVGYLDKIVQYVGATDVSYTNGYFYKCVSDGQDPATYSWTAVEVQAGGGGGLPSQTGNSGKFLTTDGTDASWSDKPLVNTANYPTQQVGILGTPYNNMNSYGVVIGAGAQQIGPNRGVAIGYNAKAGIAYSSSASSVAIGNAAEATADGFSVAIGSLAKSTAYGAIQIGDGTNSTSATFNVGLRNPGGTNNYQLLSSDGTIPAARHASLPATDGTYVLKLVIASGVPTLSWVAE